MGKASGGPRARRDAPLLATGGVRGSALGRKYDLLGYQLLLVLRVRCSAPALGEGVCSYLDTCPKAGAAGASTGGTKPLRPNPRPGRDVWLSNYM